MNAESPIAAVAAALMLAAYTATQLAAALPSPGEPGFPAVLATFAAFFGGAWEYARARSWERVQLQAFKAGFVFTGIGIGLYLIGLATGLY